jgi:uncharacterized protein YndB with AHSA1/START domain
MNLHNKQSKNIWKNNLNYKYDQIQQYFKNNNFLMSNLNNSQFLATINKSFNLDIKTVWTGLTDPATVKEYFFGTNLISDFKVGSSIKLTGVFEGKEYVDGGTILEIDPPHKLVYDYLSSWSNKEDKPENYDLVTYELIETAPNITKLTITQECDSQKAKDDSEKNWIFILDEMEKVLLKN